MKKLLIITILSVGFSYTQAAQYWDFSAPQRPQKDFKSELLVKFIEKMLELNIDEDLQEFVRVNYIEPMMDRCNSNNSYEVQSHFLDQQSQELKNFELMKMSLGNHRDFERLKNALRYAIIQLNG